MANDLSIEALTDIEETLNNCNRSVEHYLFDDKISKYRYSKIIEMNPDVADRLRLLLHDEVALRVKIRLMKSIAEIKKEIKQLSADANILRMAQQLQEDRNQALETIMMRTGFPEIA